MSRADIAKVIGAVVAVSLLALGVWLVFTGRVGPMKELEARNARERMQRQINETQRQQNLRRPFEAINFP
jgi:hypothetical protein